MKRTVIASLVALALVGSLTPSAHALSAYAIWWSPDKVDDDGFGIGMRHKASFTPLIGIDARISYVSFSDADTGIIPLEATGFLKFGMLYGGVGLGYYFFTGDSALEDAFGWYVLGGVDIGIGALSVFGELKWQMLEPDSELPGGSPISFDTLGVHLGVNFGI
jgi:hypothetical protein